MMRNAYIDTITQLALENDNIMVLVADNGAIVYDNYRQKFPDRFINFGISESNMIGASAAMANCGIIPFVYTNANFLVYRPYEFLRNVIAYNNANVKMISLACGICYSALGVSHMATEDIALMRVLPNFTIFSPASPLETKEAVKEAVKIKGPVYIRISTGQMNELYMENSINFVKGKGVVLQEGSDCTVICTGTIVNEALKANEALKNNGVSVEIINVHTLNELDEQLVIRSAIKTRKIITLEEHSVIGGLGDLVASTLTENGVHTLFFEKLGINGFPKGYGSYEYAKKVNCLDSNTVYNTVMRSLL